MLPDGAAFTRIGGAPEERHRPNNTPAAGVLFELVRQQLLSAS
jgi:hypothetical protein